MLSKGCIMNEAPTVWPTSPGLRETGSDMDALRTTMLSCLLPRVSKPQELGMEPADVRASWYGRLVTTFNIAGFCISWVCLRREAGPNSVL